MFVQQLWDFMSANTKTYLDNLVKFNVFMKMHYLYWILFTAHNISQRAPLSIEPYPNKLLHCTQHIHSGSINFSTKHGSLWAAIL